MEFDEEKRKNRNHWVVGKFESLDDMRKQHVTNWQAVSGAERRRAAWELAVHYWVVEEGRPEEDLQLQKDVGSARSGWSKQT
ncbi:MAG: hypothetical protein CMO55_24645 [Verrucomicrobiales bacterium]|nr:hypothetical protein [Verrucomicrobiales bacterium]